MIAETLEAYQRYLERMPLSAHTRRAYVQRVKGYLQWLFEMPEGANALTDPVERDYQIREYKQFLLLRGSSPNSINGALSAVDNFCISTGMARGKVKRLEPPIQAPALTLDEEKRLRKALQYNSVRNRALMLLMMNTGMRISEVEALNVGDITLTARTGEVKIRLAKGQKQRTILLNAEAREVLQTYVATLPLRSEAEPFFVSQKKSRLSKSSIDREVRKSGIRAGIQLSAHDLRHTFITRLVRAGNDLVKVAAVSGHDRLENLRRYSQPTEAEMQQMLERLSHAV